jgi:hypothetical protein
MCPVCRPVKCILIAEVFRHHQSVPEVFRRFKRFPLSFLSFISHIYTHGVENCVRFGGLLNAFSLPKFSIIIRVYQSFSEDSRDFHSLSSLSFHIFIHMERKLCPVCGPVKCILIAEVFRHPQCLLEVFRRFKRFPLSFRSHIYTLCQTGGCACPSTDRNP